MQWAFAIVVGICVAIIAFTALKIFTASADDEDDDAVIDEGDLVDTDDLVRKTPDH